MCGICGFSGKSDDILLNDMGNAIRHRGPDDSGCYSDNRMNLCSRRLSILDLELGLQPAYNEDSSVIAVFNGEIYNYKEWIPKLKKRGHKFYSHHSDSELIVHLYEEYGMDFVEKLNGMYAIALWDRKKERLLLIRDRMGIKPLFYFYNGNDIVFASEIKSILLHPGYKKKINTAALYSYFSFHNICSPATAFCNIYALRPGTILIYEHGKMNLSTYFKLSFRHTCKDSPETAVEKIRWLLEDAVNIRMDADVEIGSFLSGGLDSGIITALAANQSNDTLKTFCLGHEIETPGPLYQKDVDVCWADKIAETYRTKHTLATMRADDIIENMDAIIRAFDQPFAASSSTYFLSREAHTKVKAVLSGDGADELFGSYPLQQLAFPMQNFSRMKKQGTSFTEMNLSLLEPFSDRRDYLEQLYEFCEGNEILLSYRLLNMTDMDKTLFLSDAVFGDFLKKKSTLLQLKEIFSFLDGGDVLNHSLQYYQTTFLPDQVLSYTDALSMAHGLEIRSPFLDYRLVNYVNSLPGSYKIHNGETKYLLKRAAKGLLPKDLIYRKKEGFIPPIHDWLRNELKEYVADTLNPASVSAYPFLKEDAVLFLLHKYYSNPQENDNLADIIWNLLCFQKWCELYV